MIRRIISICLYAIGGMFLCSSAMMAFATSDEVSKPLMLAFIAPFYLVPLGLGALASPGRRLFEVGLVCLISAGFTAFTIGSLIYMMAMPDMARFFPPEPGLMLGDYFTGVLNLALVTAAGWIMFKRGSRTAEGPASAD